MDAFRSDKAIKLVMLGNSSVGKTSVVMQLYRSVFHEENEPTVGGNYITKTMTTTNGPVTLNIWDTAGQEKFRGLVPMYTRGCQAAVIMFSIQDDDSYGSIETWIDFIQKTESYKCRIYICANKIDIGQTRILSEAKAWALKNKYKLYVTSAKDQTSVVNMFTAIAQDLSKMEKKHFDSVKPPQPYVGEKSSGCC